MPWAVVARLNDEQTKSDVHFTACEIVAIEVNGDSMLPVL